MFRNYEKITVITMLKTKSCKKRGDDFDNATNVLFSGKDGLNPLNVSVAFI